MLWSTLSLGLCSQVAHSHRSTPTRHQHAMIAQLCFGFVRYSREDRRHTVLVAVLGEFLLERGPGDVAVFPRRANARLRVWAISEPFTWLYAQVGANRCGSCRRLCGQIPLLLSFSVVKGDAQTFVFPSALSSQSAPNNTVLRGVGACGRPSRRSGARSTILKLLLLPRCEIGRSSTPSSSEKHDLAKSGRCIPNSLGSTWHSLEVASVSVVMMRSCVRIKFHGTPPCVN